MTDELKDAAESFLIEEFQNPPEDTGEDSFSMYEYRSTLASLAFQILGGTFEDEDDEDGDVL